MLKKTTKNIALILILFFVVYNFLLSDFNPMFKNERFVYLTSALKETEKEDLKSIVEIYNKIHKTHKKKRCLRMCSYYKKISNHSRIPQKSKHF